MCSRRWGCTLQWDERHGTLLPETMYYWSRPIAALTIRVDVVRCKNFLEVHVKWRRRVLRGEQRAVMQKYKPGLTDTWKGQEWMIWYYRVKCSVIDRLCQQWTCSTFQGIMQYGRHFLECCLNFPPRWELRTNFTVEALVARKAVTGVATNAVFATSIICTR